jgi:nitrous oxidase accessory protein
MKTTTLRALALWAATWRLQPGADIQAAINRAAPGDTVEIERGFYDQNLRIEKPLTLRGINRPVISGGQRGDTIRVTATDVVIEGLQVRDSGTSLLEQHSGIYLQPGAQLRVELQPVRVLDREGQRRPDREQPDHRTA